MNSKLVLSIALLLNISLSHACMNTYEQELRMGYIDIQHELAQAKKNPPKTFEQLNDYGVVLIQAHRYQEAIEIFEQLEKQRQNVAQTAANLGTAYELAGQISKARYWIQQGIKRNAHIHEGSEWIHLKILDAQMKQNENPEWIKQNDVFGLNFGNGAAPKAKVKQIEFDGQRYNLNQIFEHSKIQMLQRLSLVDKDPITAQILFNMANIEVIQMGEEEDAAGVLYSTASHLGYHDPELLQMRKDYISHSKWYAFKRFFAEIIHIFS